MRPAIQTKWPWFRGRRRGLPGHAVGCGRFLSAAGMSFVNAQATGIRHPVDPLGVIVLRSAGEDAEVRAATCSVRCHEPTPASRPFSDGSPRARWEMGGLEQRWHAHTLEWRRSRCGHRRRPGRGRKGPYPGESAALRCASRRWPVKFPYRRYQVRGSTGSTPRIIHRPVIPIRLTGPGGDLRLFALVDTGADETLFPRWAAEQIEVPVDESKPLDIVGIGGHRVSALPGHVEFELTDDQQVYQWPSVVRFASWPESQTQLAILGHAGCLNFFTTIFDGHARAIDITPNSTFPGSTRSTQR